MRTEWTPEQVSPTDPQLPHAARIAKQLAVGHREEAIAAHNAHVAAELERAKSEPINLSDLMAGAEAFVLDDIQTSSEVAST